MVFIIHYIMIPEADVDLTVTKFQIQRDGGGGDIAKFLHLIL
ncbi:MAG: hypothetical protein PHN55_13720 [Dysgonamonadaceae bacterium]|nr:hypothetical protein [Dysgonamonadaceae bacterium]